MRALVVDAFTDTAFRGNPAGVVLLDRPARPEWMQTVAAELRHSETAFVHPLDAAGRYGLRWFTPAVEVDLCGHATLAAAHVLGRSGETLTFETRSGPLTTTVAHDGTVTMDFPAVAAVPADAPAGAASAPLASRRRRCDEPARTGSSRSLDHTTSRGCNLTCPYSRRWSAAG